MTGPEVVVIRQKVKRISLQRSICSLIFHGEGINLAELHVLYQNQLWLQEKCVRDLTFREKYGGFVLNLSIILKSVNLSNGLSEGAISSLRGRLVQVKDDLYPQRNIQQCASKVSQSFYLKSYKQSGIETKRLPPKRYIGVGYRDKGTAREPHLDGSPRWQEVASYVSSLEREVKELLHELKTHREVGPRLRFEVLRQKQKRIRFIISELRRINDSTTNS